jgi:hypothetical protein
LQEGVGDELMPPNGRVNVIHENLLADQSLRAFPAQQSMCVDEGNLTLLTNAGQRLGHGRFHAEGANVFFQRTPEMGFGLPEIRPVEMGSPKLVVSVGASRVSPHGLL